MARLYLLTSTGGRGVPLFASAAAHAAIAMAVGVGGHAPGAFAGASAVQEIAVEVEPAPPSPAPLNGTAEGPPARAEPPHHTHPYPVPPDHDARPHDPSIDHRLPSSVSPLAKVPADEAAAAPAALRASSPMPRFSMVLGGVTMSTGGLGSATGDQPTPGGGQGAISSEPLSESAVSTPARLLSGPRPVYPAAARASEREADVMLELVVDASGAVAAARLVRGAGFGFDDSALAAVRAYRFAPATRHQAPAPVRMRWTVQFRLD